MILKEVLSQLEQASGPVAKVFQRGEQFKVIVLGFKKGMALKEHKTGLKAKLLTIEGSVRYKEAEKAVVLNKFDEQDIPINVFHSVEALEDSLCILIQG